MEADEVTYPAHILVRYDLEKAMIVGDLRIEDLPSAFNEGIRALLGLTVPNDRSGACRTSTGRGSLGILPDLHAGGHDGGPALPGSLPGRA